VATLHLSSLLEQVEEALAPTNLHELVEEVESSGRDLVDHAFKKLLLLLVIACGLVLVTTVLHRRLTRGPGSTPQA